MIKKVFKIVKFSSAFLIIAIALIYISFSALMIATENHWVEDEPFHDAIDVRSNLSHSIGLIDNGIQSLAMRLKLIREAKQSIDLEFFIYELDTSSRIITQALVKRAQDGIKIRLLVDFSFTVLDLRPQYAQHLERAGINIKYYNTSSVARFFAVQHRTHRKLLIADDQKVILGGRNIGDDYFDLSPRYNFLDSDILLEGQIVGDIRKSFDLYWNSEWAVEADDMLDDTQGKEVNNDFLEVTEPDAEVLSHVESRTESPVLHQCNDIRFITDYPGSGVNYRKVYRGIVELVGNAKSEILAESPYFIMREDGLKVIEQLSRKGVSLSVLTNSLGSTDAYYTVASLFPHLSELKIEPFKVYAYIGEPLENYKGLQTSRLWGIHSKRAVIDKEIVMLGTYNIDPRSANLNSELMVVCYDSENFAMQVQDSIQRRLSQSKLIVDHKDSYPGNLIGEAASEDIIAMILVMPVANLFNFLL